MLNRYIGKADMTTYIANIGPLQARFPVCIDMDANNMRDCCIFNTVAVFDTELEALQYAIQCGFKTADIITTEKNIHYSK